MNFLVTYHFPNGRSFKKRTYTFTEADMIASVARSRDFKDVTITPLNDTARFTMSITQTLIGCAKDVFGDILK